MPSVLVGLSQRFHGLAASLCNNVTSRARRGGYPHTLRTVQRRRIGVAVAVLPVHTSAGLTIFASRLGAPLLQCHRGLHRFDALGSRSNGLRECGLEALIGFDQSRVLIDRRGERRLGYQFAALPVAHRRSIASLQRCART